MDNDIDEDYEDQYDDEEGEEENEEEEESESETSSYNSRHERDNITANQTSQNSLDELDSSQNSIKVDDAATQGGKKENDEFDLDNEELIEFVQNDNHAFEQLWQDEKLLSAKTGDDDDS